MGVPEHKLKIQKVKARDRTEQEKIKKEDEAKAVAKAIDDLITKDRATFRKLLHAVDNRDQNEFFAACDDAGINDDALKRYLLRITFLRSIYDTKAIGDASYCWS